MPNKALADAVLIAHWGILGTYAAVPAVGNEDMLRLYPYAAAGLALHWLTNGWECCLIQLEDKLRCVKKDTSKNFVQRIVPCSVEQSNWIALLFLGVGTFFARKRLKSIAS